MRRALWLMIATVMACAPPSDPDTPEDVAPAQRDLDGDGFCADTSDCGAAEDDPGDCDDGNPATFPGATEACNGVDDDCDGEIDERWDADGDGYFALSEDCLGLHTPDQLDCDDFLPRVNPGAEEDCDGRDTDCNGIVDDGLDQDGDGFRSCDAPADCDDWDPNRFPGAPERCNGLDDNCDQLPDNGFAIEFLDYDVDGYSPCTGDCDDGDDDINPGAPDACGDGVDSDCDGEDCP